MYQTRSLIELLHSSLYIIHSSHSISLSATCIEHVEYTELRKAFNLSSTFSYHLPQRILRISRQWQNGDNVVGRVAFSCSSVRPLSFWKGNRVLGGHAVRQDSPSPISTAQQTRNYTPYSEDPTKLERVPKRIHILGLGNVGKLIAHSLRGIAEPPPITLIAHKRALYNAWMESRKEITLQTDGFVTPARGFEMELEIPRWRIHGVEITDPDFINDHPTALLPHEAAAQYKKEMEKAGGNRQPFGIEPFEEREPGEIIHNLIVTVKAPKTLSALNAVKHRLLPTSSICFLQNGMGIIDEVNKQVFPDPETRPTYIQGIVTHGLNSPSMDNPFFSIHAGHGTISLGILPRSSRGDATYVSDLQGSVGFPPTARYIVRTMTRTPVLAAIGLPPLELLQQQLEKLAQNAVINPLTVMLDARNGSILYNFPITRTMRLLLGEISLVMRSLPEIKDLPNVADRFSPQRLETLVVGIANQTRDNVSSMLADVRNASSRTEIKYLNGYIIKRGEEVGVQCVCNYLMMQMVLGKTAMIHRERNDEIPMEREDLTGEKR